MIFDGEKAYIEVMEGEGFHFHYVLDSDPTTFEFVFTVTDRVTRKPLLTKIYGVEDFAKVDGSTFPNSLCININANECLSLPVKRNYEKFYWSFKAVNTITGYVNYLIPVDYRDKPILKVYRSMDGVE